MDSGSRIVIGYFDGSEKEDSPLCHLVPLQIREENGSLATKYYVPCPVLQSV